MHWLLRLRPAIVPTHTAKAGSVGRLAGFFYRWLTPGVLVGRPRRCRFVHTYHGHIFHSYYGRWKTWFFLQIERLLARLATDRIIVISPQQYQEIHHKFGVGRAEQFAVIPLGLDVEAFADWSHRRGPARQALGACEGEILVGIVGRLTEVKNHRLVLQAASLYARKPGARPVRFLVIGDGHLRTALENEARTLGLADHVRFLGTRPDPENFYPALDIVALTSHNEGTPLSILEAMVNGRAVIATTVGGVPDLLGGTKGPPDPQGFSFYERGVGVRPNDAAGFAAGLARLIDDPSLRDAVGESGRNFVEQHYAKERLIDDIDRLYQDLLGQERKTAIRSPWRAAVAKPGTNGHVTGLDKASPAQQPAKAAHPCTS